MEQTSKHPSVSGSSNCSSLSVNIAQNFGVSAWGISSRFSPYHESSDASLFSSSLPVLPHEKLNVTDAEHGVISIDDASSSLNKVNKDMESKDSVESLDHEGIGSLLPDDEDELLAGIMDDFDLSGLPSQVEELEECDLFGSGGGMELDTDPTENLTVGLAQTHIGDGYAGNEPVQYAFTNGAGTVTGEHPYGEHPSRTLFVRNINSNVEDSELRSLFEQYGDIRTLYTACKHRGFVMISYYDIRDARTAMRALQNKPLRRRKLDIHFSIPKDNPSDKDLNQGTLVVFNLDPSVSNDDLRQIFGAHGEVKEIRETPHKRHHKFIEFYDVRAAESALRSLNRSDIAGKRIKLEPSRPGGARRNLMQQLSQELELDETKSYRHPVGSPISNSPPANWPQLSSPSDNGPLRALSQSQTSGAVGPIANNHVPGLASIIPSMISNSSKITPIGKERANHVDQVFSHSNATLGAPFQHSRSFPEHGGGIMLNVGPSPGASFGPLTSSTSVTGTLNGPQFLWGSPTPYSEHAQSAWPTSSIRNSFQSKGQRQGFPYSSHLDSFLASSHHVGSAPSGVPFERHFGYIPESPDSSLVRPIAYGSMGVGGRNEGNLMVNLGVPGPVNPGLALSGINSDSGSPGFRMMQSQRLGHLFLGNIMGSIDRGRSRRIDNGGQLESKKQYQLDLEKIVNGEDTRTTLMIKNIPNKYTSKMLLAAIDETHRGTYDFFYLPIDFKNKCNVGYAFINMVSPSHIISFYQAFNGKKWEKFNSEKVASLAFARIQGKAALVAHFQNSSLMNEDKRCRPILFNSEGLEAGDQESFPPNGIKFHICQQDATYLGDSPESLLKNIPGQTPEQSTPHEYGWGR